MSGGTIQEVARAAGVSAATVSNYLNDRAGRVGAAAAERIAAAIAALDYRPNGVARQLKTGRTPMIGLLVPTVSNPFFAELAVAIERAARLRGWGMLLCNTLRESAVERDALDRLASFGVRGLVTASALDDSLTWLLARERRAHVVAVDVRQEDVGNALVDVVSLDNAGAAAAAVDHLVDLGHRHLAHVTAPGDARSRVHRRDGFLAAAARHGLPPPPVLVGEAPRRDVTFADTDLLELGRATARRLVELRPRPTAVLALNDMTAIGLMRGLGELDHSVPEDVSVVGIDDILLGRLLTPALTTVRQPTEAMAAAAVTILLSRLEGDEAPPNETIFAPEVVRRQSTGAIGHHGMRD